MIRCRRIYRAAARHHRRFVKRAMTVAVSKPMVIGYVCIATYWPAPLPIEHAQAAISTPATSIEIPPEFFVLPPEMPAMQRDFEIIGQPILLPTVPSPAPEPASIAILATALLGMLAITRRRAPC